MNITFCAIQCIPPYGYNECIVKQIRLKLIPLNYKRLFLAKKISHLLFCKIQRNNFSTAPNKGDLITILAVLNILNIFGDAIL